MKLAGEKPAPAPVAEPVPNEPTQPADDAGFGASGGEAPADDKPFDDEPFDAGVEANEESDPKKYIEQLSGKLGQSLRNYTENQGGQPDFDLEKFAINSVVSATHSGEMDEEDKNDIIKKVNTAGGNGGEDSSEDSNNDLSDSGNGDENGGNGDFGGDDNFGDEESNFDDELKEGKLTNLMAEPKKCNMFQPGNPGNLEEGIISKNYLLKRLHETFNREEEKVEKEVKPITPSRRSMPFTGMSKKEIEEDKGKNNYQVYHDTFSSAVQTVSNYVTSRGFELNEDEWFNQVATGPKKPNEGETNQYSLSIYKDGKEQKKMCHFQVYNMGNKYELNMYFN